MSQKYYRRGDISADAKEPFVTEGEHSELTSTPGSTRQYHLYFSSTSCSKKKPELKRHMWRYDSEPPYCIVARGRKGRSDRSSRSRHSM